MKITVIGCGNAGTAVGADLALKGNEVTLLKTSSSMHNSHFEFINNTGTIILLENGERHIAGVKVTTSYEEAIPKAEIIIIFVQTNYHEQVIKMASKYMKDGQIVLVEPGYLCTAFMLKYCHKDITVVEAESSPIDCRIIEPGTVKVLFRNVRNPIGVYPIGREELALEKLNKFGYNFEKLKSVVEAALHNPNLIVHTVGAIMSVPRIEYACLHQEEYSMYKEAFTPHVWNLVIGLDNEKMKVLKAVGCEPIKYVEACRNRNSLDETRDATDVFFDYANNSAPSGPYEPDSRYITEDVSQGLVMLESLGFMLEIQTPICTALIDIASSMFKRDFRKEGRTIEVLGRENIKRILWRNRF